MKFIILGLAAVLMFIGLVRYLEIKSIFFPEKDVSVTPAATGLGFQDIFFKAKDGTTLHGWFVPSQEATLTMIVFHGNAGSISNRIDKIAIFHRLGLNVFIFDYRGYGKSAGSPGEQGLYKDADAAYDHVTTKLKIAPEHIILYGESLGGAVAIDLAARKKVGGLIVEESFTSIKDIARKAFPFVPSFIVSNTFNSKVKIRHVTCAKLIIHSKDDEMIPYSMGLALYRAAEEPKRLITISGDHNSAVFASQPVYEDALISFLGDLSERRALKQ